MYSDLRLREARTRFRSSFHFQRLRGKTRQVVGAGREFFRAAKKPKLTRDKRFENETAGSLARDVRKGIAGGKGHGPEQTREIMRRGENSGEQYSVTSAVFHP